MPARPRACVGAFTAFALALSACASSPPPDQHDLLVSLRTSGGSQSASVAVTGLSAAELAALRQAGLSDASWEALLRVTVGATDGDSLPAVKGRYSVDDTSLTFSPRFPFDPGRSYQVRFDPSKMPHPRAAPPVTAAISIPAKAITPTTVVSAVHPSADVVPENLLRIYIEFSAPMGSRGAQDYVRLIEITGSKEDVVEEAFLPIEADFWSPDHRRYTIFLDPGRVKEGILPNRERGRPLKAGHRYVLEIGRDWPDANRLPLASGYRHEFRAGTLMQSAITLADWRVTAPSARTRDPLVVVFPRALDHAVVMRALGVETASRDKASVAGAARIEHADTQWTFTPSAAWVPGQYALTAQAFLEDPQGNQINVPFEEAVDAPKPERRPEAFTIPFRID